MEMILLGGIFLLLLLLRVPVAISLFATAVTFAILTGALPPSSLASTATYGVDSFTLLAIPGFILVAEIMNRSTISQRIFDFAQSCVGHLTGGLAQVNVLASLIFAGMSGSVIADIAGIGRIQIEEMTKRDYPLDFSAAITASSASIGPILPPSIIMIVYAAAAGQSTTAMFIAGIVPAFILAGFLMISVRFQAHGKEWGRAPREDWKERGKKFLRAFPALMTPIIILVGIIGGYWTPTEAGAVTSVYAFIIAKWFYRDFRWRDLWGIFERTARSTGNIMLIFAGAHVFARLVALQGIPRQLTQAVEGITQSPILVTLLIIVILLVGGAFMQPTPFLLIILPVITALALTFDIDLVHLGTVAIVTLMLGNLTPPFAMGLYAVSDIVEVPFNGLVRKIVPFYLPMLAAVLVLALLPPVVLYLPGLLN